MIGNIKLIFTKPFVGFKRISVGVAIAIMLAFMFVSANWIFGAYEAQVVQILTLYLMIFLLIHAFVGKKPATSSDPKESWMNFVIMFLITSAILIPFVVAGYYASIAGIFEIQVVAAFTLTGFGFGALHAFGKAYIEEEIFRNALPISAGIGDLIANMLFALFHLAVLVTIRGFTITEVWIPIIVLLFLGLAWSRVRNAFGIMGSTGSHFAWNLFAMGVLLSMFTAGVV